MINVVAQLASLPGAPHATGSGRPDSAGGEFAAVLGKQDRQLSQAVDPRGPSSSRVNLSSGPQDGSGGPGASRDPVMTPVQPGRVLSQSDSHQQGSPSPVAARVTGTVTPGPGVGSAPQGETQPVPSMRVVLPAEGGQAGPSLTLVVGLGQDLAGVLLTVVVGGAEGTLPTGETDPSDSKASGDLMGAAYVPTDPALMQVLAELAQALAALLHRDPLQTGAGAGSADGAHAPAGPVLTVVMPSGLGGGQQTGVTMASAQMTGSSAPQDSALPALLGSLPVAPNAGDGGPAGQSGSFLQHLQQVLTAVVAELKNGRSEPVQLVYLPTGLVPQALGPDGPDGVGAALMGGPRHEGLALEGLRGEGGKGGVDVPDVVVDDGGARAGAILPHATDQGGASPWSGGHGDNPGTPLPHAQTGSATGVGRGGAVPGPQLGGAGDPALGPASGAPLRSLQVVVDAASPERVRISVSLVDSTVQAQIISGQPELRHLLSQDQGRLQEQLRGVGLELNRLDILAGGEEQALPQRQDQTGLPWQPRPAHHEEGRPGEGEGTEVSSRWHDRSSSVSVLV